MSDSYTTRIYPHQLQLKVHATPCVQIYLTEPTYPYEQSPCRPPHLSCPFNILLFIFFSLTTTSPIVILWSGELVEQSKPISNKGTRKRPSKLQLEVEEEDCSS